MLKLGVNVDHVATLRQQRGGLAPDPVEAAKVCERAGAHSIVMHLREDRRHIQDDDLYRAKSALGIRLNMEMAAADTVIRTALAVKPAQVTLVPEKRKERTTESGLDLFRNEKKLGRFAEACRKCGIEVSYFIEPDEKQVKKALSLGADAVEFHTGAYALASGLRRQRSLFSAIAEASEAAVSVGLLAHAGHGLDYENVKPFRGLGTVTELNIGYSIVTRAIWTGLERAVKDMLGAIGPNG